MKHLEVMYTNNEVQMWYIPANEKLEKSIKGIEEEVGLQIIDYKLVRGYN